MSFLPVSKKEVKGQLDFVYIIGDAYVDHPSFGHAIISRVLESHGYSVGIIAQPDFRNSESITEFGEPRLAFLISGGNMDSMVNHYTVAKKHRKTDAYTPGGEMGKRPDRAVIVYGNLVRQQYKKTPIIIGGIEASLRRLAHYDYWSDKLKRSILLDSGANLISYGMGERSIVEIADALNAGIAIEDITFIDGTVYKTKSLEAVYDYELLPDYDALLADKKTYAKSFLIQYENTDPFAGKRLVEPYGSHCYVVQNPAAKPLSQAEMDEIYALPYMRTWHPGYNKPKCEAFGSRKENLSECENSFSKAGGIPAFSEVKFSLVSNRGCFGGCSFCALTFHQGRIVQTRSHESIIEEAELMTEDQDFKGYIHDVGGPTANFRAPACEKQLKKGVCPKKQCLFPTPCKNLEADHKDYITLLRKLRSLPKVKKVFIRSGIRFDYLLADSSRDFLKELCQYHVSGQLKVAPEHVSDKVLKKMGKPGNEVFQQFSREYQRMNEKLGVKQYLVPYLMSSHPGCDMKEAVKLAEFVRDLGYMPEQVQDFYPTPSTISTCMYYTGIDPRTGESVYVPKDPHEKELQRALIQYRDPKNYDLIKEALEKAGRTDLIGFDKKCLIRPRKLSQEKRQLSGKNKNGEKRPVKGKSIRNVHKKKHSHAGE